MQFPNASNLTFAPYTSETWTSFYGQKSLYTLVGNYDRRTWSSAMFLLTPATRIPGLHWRSVALCYHTSTFAYPDSCLWDFRWERGPRFIREGSLMLARDCLGNLVFHGRAEHVLVEDQAKLEPKTWFKDNLNIEHWFLGAQQAGNQLVPQQTAPPVLCSHKKR